jgi:DNA repair photolyase
VHEPVAISVRGRGTGANPQPRFAPLTVVRDPDVEAGDGWGPDDGDFNPAPSTQFYRDASRSIIAYNDSPDVGFSASINAYRGCEHGCIYCFARPGHEYLDWSAGLDFESKILVKPDAPRLLREELGKSSWKPQVVQCSGVTDCYQPVERRLRLTRQCLEVLAEFRNPVSILTKNHLVTRDIDLFTAMVPHQTVVVLVSITTLDAELARRMEPRASAPARRLDAVRRLAAAGVPVGVMVAPIIPGLNDEHMPGVLEAVAEAGARWAGFTLLRLPWGVKDLFVNWLGEHYPDRKEKVLGRQRSIRGGKLNDSRFGERMAGEGFWAQQIRQIFKMTKSRVGLDRAFPTLRTDGFVRRGVGAEQRQMSLW